MSLKVWSNFWNRTFFYCLKDIEMFKIIQHVLFKVGFLTTSLKLYLLFMTLPTPHPSTSVAYFIF
jgi:hypothetical protein